jgi:hypothetical protein
MKSHTTGATMTTSLKSILTAITLAAATLLTGCATPNMQATFNRGDEVLFGRVNLSAESKDAWEARDSICGSSYQKYKNVFYSLELDLWVTQTGFCKIQNLDGIKQVQVEIGVVNVNGDRFNLVAFPATNFELDKGDIVAVKIYPSSDGRFRRPAEILRVAAKAKDATKKNGCYWDAFQMGPFRGQGGAVCEGWHWKDHPYSNPDLLKK